MGEADLVRLATPGEKPMLSRLFRRDRHGEAIASSLYGAIVAQARKPALYAGLGVPDSVSGRFEMVLLHTILVTRRLQSAGEAAREAGQGVFDRFCQDMDHSLREMGVGDLSVPKKMRKVGEAYFGRAAAYEPGLAAGDAGLLAEPIGRTVLADGAGTGAASALAAYAIAVAGKLAAQEEGAIVESGPDFPDPQSFVFREPAR
jgi:cytochrome b pre-mRNA-processing protein 3